MITNNFLNEHITPDANTGEFRWDYNTFGYGFGITFWSRLEIAYVCTLFNGKWSPSAKTYRQQIIRNQDRHVSAKVVLLKENEFGLKWMPALALGARDIDNGMFSSHMEGDGSNGYFTCIYAVASKHFKTSIGEFSGHIGYQYNRRSDYRLNAPCAAVTWNPIWLDNRWFNPKIIFEYDSRTPNIGFIADIWDDRFEAMFMLQKFQWISFGLRFKLQLSGSEN